ncbi:Protein Star [Orchesella cincta]|uniref:Protein Star n=1 Tax=Orchesella cincta TaxID=48709 RepID=A0A1D2MBH4_ORCCI|nr:Protein Star [Orchesella cincta]
MLGKVYTIQKMKRVGLSRIYFAAVLCFFLILYIFQPSDLFLSLKSSLISYRATLGRSGPIIFDGELRKYILESGTSHQENPLLIELVRNELLIQPSTIPYNISSLDPKNVIPTNLEKLKMLEDLIIDKSKPGFFIECGANDGEFISPTLLLEQAYNWTGLLIEANPEPFSKLATKNRNAWLINVALCTRPFAKQVQFFTNPNNTGLAGLNERKYFGVNVPLNVQCVPLFTILAALNITEIDYFSLDVEGLELEILKTVPFDKIKFKFLTVEHWSIPGGRVALQLFMESKGYIFIKEVNDLYTRDSVFIHKSLRHKLRNLKQR